jgi:acyl-[acyl-carrier-protein]-phospholipid O-acyltransferase/long-chain-fatty-acid--[acyl-carrier-protein] ligase
MLQLRVLRTARRRWRRFAMADSTGQTLTFGRALVGALLLSRAVRRTAGSARMVGLMLPASVGGAIANLAVLFAGKVPVNLNFTAGPAATAHAIEQCRIRTIITSRTFLARAKLAEISGMVFLEDLLRERTTWSTVRVALEARLLPPAWLRRRYMPEALESDDLATVIFSSGSTGIPKGVMLSHRNILANVEGMAQVFHLTDEDRILGVLPFFHSFGFTGSLWLPLITGFGAVYHPNPMDAQVIGEMVQKHRATLLIATPTFCNSYTRRCTPEQFASLKHAIVGAEKLREPAARAFRERFGLELLEGYGCTEMSPVISVNVPDPPGGGPRTLKTGTVGRPLPNVDTKVVHADTGAPLAAGTPGLLLVRGDNRMLGYLDNPEMTAQVLRDGWYVTGDIASVDEEGFITLTDRLSRFSKLGGEMVPHLKIEEVISQILDGAACVVTGVPDESKGERLVAFYTKDGVSPADLWNALNDSDLPKLWIPKRQDLRVVTEIPLLGTGKVDLKRVRTLAEA